MPERLGRKVCPDTERRHGSAPDLQPLHGSAQSRPSVHPLIREKRYGLVELIDLAQRMNPETRVAWEAARQAAIGLGWWRASISRCSR